MRDEDWNEQTDDEYQSSGSAMLVIGPSGYYAAA